MRRLTRSLITILVLFPFAFHILSFEGFDFLNTLERWSYDTRITLTMPNTREEGIVIVDIDEKSIAEIGQWPWKRDILAKMVDSLFEYYEIDILGFDMQFPERDRHDDIDLLNELEAKFQGSDIATALEIDKLREQRDRDVIFADSIRGKNVVLGYTLSEESIEIGKLPKAVIDLSINPEYSNLPFLELSGHIGNYSVLQNSTEAGGNFNPLVIDDDGKIRAIAMLSRKDDKIYESLSMAVARKALGVETIRFGHDGFDDNEPVTRENVASVFLGDREYAIGDEMEMLVPYRGYEGQSFNYVSAVDVINRKTEKNKLNGRIVLVGSRASGLRDLRVTPISENFPGVEINANMVSGIILESVKSSDESNELMELALMVLIAILLTFLLPRFSVGFSITFIFLIILSLLLLNSLAWLENIVFPLTASLLFTISLFLVHMIYGFFIESRSKKQLSKLFGQYVPPELVDEMETDLTSYSMDTKQATLTVMFADIKGFTTLSEALEAEQVSELLNEFLTTMTEVIHEKRGTIDKYMGDAIMAFWGAPLDDEKHAQHALEAALLMQEKMQELNENLSQRNLPNIAICIGINTGNMSVGNMGSEFRMAYTVIGDSVNLASRLEALTRVYGVGIMIGENTRRQLKEVLCIELDKVTVKGKDKAVSVFEPLGSVADITPDQATMIEKHKQALQAYRDQNWSLAIRFFQELKEQFPDKYLFQLYLDRLEGFLEAPPEKNWDGIFHFTNK